MSFAESFGKSFSGAMAAKAKATDKDADKSDTSGALSGKLGKKISGLFKKPVETAVSAANKTADNIMPGNAKKGGKIPRTGTYKLHRGETVVPAGMARGLERLGKKGPQKIKPKAKKVAIGKKSFVIKHPGAFKAAAQRAGMGTKAYAQKKKSAPGVLGRRARSALGLMAMGK